jgi:single-stranded DNA-binding protein
MNRVILAGRLARDAKVSNSGKATFLTVATETGWNKEKKEPFIEFVPVTCFFGMSEKQEEIYRKGAMVLVEGQVQHREHDGTWKTNVTVSFQSGLRLMSFPKGDREEAPVAAESGDEELPF